MGHISALPSNKRSADLNDDVLFFGVNRQPLGQGVGRKNGLVLSLEFPQPKNEPFVFPHGAEHHLVLISTDRDIPYTPNRFALNKTICTLITARFFCLFENI